MIDKEKIKQGVRLLLEGIGEDVNREGLLDTPDRVARMYEEIFAGLEQDAKEPLSRTFHAKDNEMVVEKDITFYSTCEHHLMPFYGKAHVAYIPDGKVVGLSKLARTVEVYAKRPQLQEQLTAQIADALDQRRGNSGIGLAVIAHHGVHHLVGGRPQGKGFFSQRYLCFAAQIAGIDTIKLQSQLLIVLQCGHAVGTAVHPGGGAQTAGVGGKHHRGQCHRLEAHDRQHRQDHRKAAPAHAGQVVDAKDLFWFNGFLQIGKPPC